LPFGLISDVRVRGEYLFGNQTIRPFRDVEDYGGTGNGGPYPSDRYRFALNPRFPVTSAEIEVSNWSPISVRGAACVSPLKTKTSETRSLNAQADEAFSSNSWEINRSFYAWEVAGLYHAWVGGGYRFSILAGYRREEWFNKSENDSDQVWNAALEDRLWSHMPFMGLQTSMAFPGWMARFEFIGSPFMKKHAEGFWRENSSFVRYRGKATSGGGMIVRVSGTANVTPALSLGIDGQFSYQELQGDIATVDNNYPNSQRFNLLLLDMYATVGMILSYAF
jgi:hypothetical protein